MANGLITAAQFPGLAPDVSRLGTGFAQGQQIAAQQQQTSALAQQSNIQANEARLNTAIQTAAQLRSMQSIQGKIDFLKGNPSEDNDELLQWLSTGQEGRANEAIDAMVNVGQQMGVLRAPGGALTAKQREFESLTADLPEDQKQKAKLIELGLSPRAIGSAIQTISDKDIADEIGKAEATISQRKKFGEMTGASRAKAIDSGFERIVKIDQGLVNIDRAIAALEGGAKTGAIEKFLPSIRAASVELSNVRNSMALDVIGAVTFGALSKGELDLAKEVALPVGLNEPQLIEHLKKRREAQQKLRSYFQEQINFLDQGGSVAGFLRSKDRETQGQGAEQPQQPVQAQTAQPAAPVNVGRFQIEVVQ